MNDFRRTLRAKLLLAMALREAMNHPSVPDSNNQGIPGQGGTATDPTSFFQCLRGDYTGSDGVDIRPTQRVLHSMRGAGVVESLLGGSGMMQQKVMVQFDSGTRISVPSNELKQNS